MQAKIRPATSIDLPGILAVADQAWPDTLEYNREWWSDRQHFETRDYRRRHYVIEDQASSSAGSGKALRLSAYGAIEEGPEENHYRLFLVLAPELFPLLGEPLYVQLEKDLRELHAEVVWAREEILAPVIDFLRSRGFIDQLRVNLPSGREGLLLAKRLDV